MKRCVKTGFYGQYVHEFTDKNGRIRYAVADYKDGQYVRPLDLRTYKLTGCHAEFTKDISTFGGYRTRTQALRRARYLFGEK